MSETVDQNGTATLPAIPPGPPAAVALREKKPVPLISVEIEGGSCRVHVGETNSAEECVALMLALGTTNYEFYTGLLHSIINAAKDGGKVTNQAVNFIASVVVGAAPRDEFEAMLAVQMAAIHNATITTARWLASVETLPQLEVQERALNKLARTFTTQMEALKRYRTGGQQKVVVEHVTVNSGGQAIVGSVSHPGPGGGTARKTESTP